MPSIRKQYDEAFGVAENHEDRLVKWLIDNGVTCRRTSSIKGSHDITTSSGHLLEVKAPKKKFDLKYVDGVDTWGRKSPKPYAYIVIPPSGKLEDCVWTQGGDCSKWLMALCTHHIDKHKYWAFVAKTGEWHSIRSLIAILHEKDTSV